MSEELDLYGLGSVTWHSSGEDAGPDVGISVGLGKSMLFVGEVPGQVGGWSMAIYPLEGERIDIAETVRPDAARDLIEKLGVMLRPKVTT